MTIHKNDIVRFLDSVGGGKVIQVDEEGDYNKLVP